MNQKRLGQFLSNIYDPRKPETRGFFCASSEAMMNGPKAEEEEWQHHLAWVQRNVIGPPKACEAGTSEELAAQGIVGIYAPYAPLEDLEEEQDNRGRV
jgi:hypothetical protein